MGAEGGEDNEQQLSWIYSLDLGGQLLSSHKRSELVRYSLKALSELEYCSFCMSLDRMELMYWLRTTELLESTMRAGVLICICGYRTQQGKAWAPLAFCRTMCMV